LEEHYADEADKLISVFHFSKEVQRTHGVPFKFVVKPVRFRLLRRENNELSSKLGRTVRRYEEAPTSSDWSVRQGFRAVPIRANPGGDFQTAIIY